MEIQWLKKAQKQLKKIKDRRLKEKIWNSVYIELSDYKRSAKIKVLINHDYQYLLRVENYRVFFNVSDEVEILFIEEVKKRDEHTY